MMHKREVKLISDSVLVALLSLLGTLAGAFSGILVSNRLVLYRLEQLEKQVSAQNAMVERVYGAEKRLDVFDEQIRLACHRIDHLEHYEM